MLNLVILEFHIVRI